MGISFVSPEKRQLFDLCRWFRKYSTYFHFEYHHIAKKKKNVTMLGKLSVDSPVQGVL